LDTVAGMIAALLGDDAREVTGQAVADEGTTFI
jgi:hypothetical protein